MSSKKVIAFCLYLRTNSRFVDRPKKVGRGFVLGFVKHHLRKSMGPHPSISRLTKFVVQSR